MKHEKCLFGDGLTYRSILKKDEFEYFESLESAITRMIEHKTALINARNLDIQAAMIDIQTLKVWRERELSGEQLKNADEEATLE